MQYNVSIGVEGQNGMLSDPRGVVHYYWHGGDSLSTWGRIVMGTSMQLDDDVTPTSSTNPLTQFEGLCDRIYLHARVYMMQLTDVRKVSDTRWAGGGTLTTWPYRNFTITYATVTGRFVPAVLPPSSDSSRAAATTLDPCKVLVIIGKVF